jgi:methylmalonyl-CoA/ethylmalonyl-CoA epimerase
MIIDHIGIAVKDINKSISYWREMFGYRQATEIVFNTKQKVNVVFLEKEESLTIKLIEPSEESSSINNFLKNGGGLHHLCFKTTDINSKVIELSGKGMIKLTPPQTGEAFENELIAFLYGRDNLNIEIIETDKKAKRLTNERNSNRPLP